MFVYGEAWLTVEGIANTYCWTVEFICSGWCMIIPFGSRQRHCDVWYMGDCFWIHPYRLNTHTLIDPLYDLLKLAYEKV